MPEFLVHVYATVKLPAVTVAAATQKEAAEVIDDRSVCNTLNLLLQKPLESAEEVTGMLVDVPGDEEHEHTEQFDVFDGKVVPAGFARDQLRKASSLLDELRNCCFEALNDEWDRSDDGFEAMIQRIDDFLKD